MNQDTESDSLLGHIEVNTTSNEDLDDIDPQTIVTRIHCVLPANFPQILSGFSATLSALSAGLVLGWTSPIFDYLINGRYNNIPINKDQIGWIGSFATLGAMAMCIPTSFICDLIGRKKTLLSIMIPFVFGWALIIWANNITALYFGRLITGSAVGACCVAAPLYTGEIVYKNLRGAIGSFFQLMIVTGIFISYLLGKFLNPYHFTIFCASMPFLFLAVFSFQPESPTYLIKRNQFEMAKKSLIRLRGNNYNVDEEILQIEGSLRNSTQSSASLRTTFCRRAVKKAVSISFALMFFQQFSGINVVILYSSDIFKSSGIKMDSNIATIVVGGVQVLATLSSSLIVEKLGRKFLLYLSLSSVSVNVALIGIYFSIKTRGHPDEEVIKDISFIPIIALCFFVIAFSLGLGPIPWMISSEILPTDIRSMVSSAAGTFNWFLAFLITKSYLNLSYLFGSDVIFYIFAVLSVIGTVFIVIFIPETKGKSISEIQEELGQ